MEKVQIYVLKSIKPHFVNLYETFLLNYHRTIIIYLQGRFFDPYPHLFVLQKYVFMSFIIFQTHLSTMLILIIINEYLNFIYNIIISNVQLLTLFQMYTFTIFI